MLKLVIFLSAVTYALSASKPGGSPRFFIAGGTDTTISSYPWQVSIQYDGKYICGGSIYNNKIIVTAAHCLLFKDVSSLKVRVGSTKWNSGGTVIQVAAYKYHEGFKMFAFENDIAVIRLSSSIEYNSTVKNITLASSAPDHGADAVTTGWGRAKVGGPNPETLQHVNVKIVGRSQCSSSPYGYGIEEIKTSMICATASEKGPCKGDSGGPLVSGGVLAGVISWVHGGCANKNFPVVYANVANFRSWIISAASSV